MRPDFDYSKSMLIDGQWCAPNRNNTIEVVNPATDETVAELSYGGAEEALEAVEAASRAFATWKQTSARQRADLLLKVSELLLQRQEEIAFILAVESGKRLAEAVGEVRFSAEYFRWFAEEARRPDGQFIPSDAPNKRHWTRSQPAGVALTLTPWNFPVSIQARKVAPALAAGCTVVARASQKAPLSVIELFRCLVDAGLPPGVVNLIQGPAATTTAAMMQHPAVRVVSFTGSTQVGQSLIRESANGIQKLALELGGNSPFIVFNDADIDKAVEGAMIAKFRNNGQSCIGANRFYVQRGVYDAFVEKFVAQIHRMKIADPVADAKSDLGPMIDHGAKGQLVELAEAAIARGATRLTDLRELPEQGSYVSPVLLADVPLDTAFSCQELFGPAAPVFVFDDEDEVLHAANNTDMGLASYLYTEGFGRATRVTEGLEYGVVGLNSALPSVAYAPMGGWKHSGMGREGARVGMEEFMEWKYIATEL
ncbi:NAD-dependent succinate-semialdehyde dehydrogenase [Alicyclobacillus mengziensis]|uniref:NAD-dependent succinate-semialdehyde dehydrogenase n=1 Tax=Alicyclobacillus mengziensis TaxID=2931921 RepID=A0A9X7W213_9BACL|nr:NAD-dependent succinate-semialdehyde dehydrogenase [Alicyclobacillus mengziensis]QSO49301.1 NAD-dependent succinate-semialdehyde dehydrogenase [Alicyclobacillus mengziensis]